MVDLDLSRAIVEREEIVREPWSVVWIRVERRASVEIVLEDDEEDGVMVRRVCVFMVAGRTKAVAEAAKLTKKTTISRAVGQIIAMNGQQQSYLSLY